MKGYIPANEINTAFDTASENPVHIERQPGAFTLDVERKAIWNNEKQHCSSIVSKQYNLVQHQDVFDSVKEALENLNLQTNFKIHDGGDRFSVDVVFEGQNIDCGKGEVFGAGFRLINSYNKTTGVTIQPFLIRLACMNGMVVNDILKVGFSVTHSSKMCLEFEAHIPKLLNDLSNSNERIKRILNNAIGDSIEWEVLDKLLNKMQINNKHKKAITEILIKNRIGKEITRWDLYNAFTNYATHGQQIKPTVERSLQRKSQILLKNNFNNIQKMELEVTI